MSELEREIRKYSIAFLLEVRGSGGSKEKRCLWDICGKPMIQWVLEIVEGSKYPQKIVVSTEDREIADLVRGLGHTVVDRPLDMSLDYPRGYTSGRFYRSKPRSLAYEPIRSKFPTVRAYTLYWLEEMMGYIPELITKVSVDTPLVRSESLDRVIEKFFKTPNAVSVTSMYPIAPNLFTINPKTNYMFPVFYDGYNFCPRQEYPPLFRAASTYIYGSPAVKYSETERNAYIVVEPEEGLMVHEKEDLFLARCFMRRRLEGGEDWLKIQKKSSA